MKICGKLLALCVITECFITAFLLPKIIKVLVSHEDVKFIAIYLKFNQDLVEAFFGQQRARGQCNDNSSVKQFMEITQTIMVQKSLAIGSISRKRTTPDLSPLGHPLPK